MFKRRNFDFPRVGKQRSAKTYGFLKLGVGENRMFIIFTIEPEKAAAYLKKQ